MLKVTYYFGLCVQLEILTLRWGCLGEGGCLRWPRGASAECLLKKVPSRQSAFTTTAPFVHCVKPNNKSAHVNTNWSSNWSHWVFGGIIYGEEVEAQLCVDTVEQEATAGKDAPCIIYTLFINDLHSHLVSTKCEYITKNPPNPFSSIIGQHMHCGIIYFLLNNYLFEKRWKYEWDFCIEKCRHFYLELSENITLSFWINKRLLWLN